MFAAVLLMLFLPLFKKLLGDDPYDTVTALTIYKIYVDFEGRLYLIFFYKLNFWMNLILERLKLKVFF